MAELTITAANVGVRGLDVTTMIGTAGEALTHGQPVRLSSEKYVTSQANDTTNAQCAGITLTSAALDQPVLIAVSGDIDLGATLTLGEQYVVSGTDGKIEPIGDLASTEIVTRLGYATAADTLTLDIEEQGVAIP